MRRSISLGPLRLNLSRTGIGLSIYSRRSMALTGPRRTFIQMGRQGLAYRQHLDMAEQGISSLDADSRGLYDSLRPDAGSLVESSGSEVLSQVNARVRQTPQAPIIVALTVLMVPAIVFFDSMAALYVAVAGLVFAYLFHNGDKHKRTSYLSYDLADDARRQFVLMQAAFQALAKANRIWLVQQETSTAHWKRNAGASSLIVRTPVSVGGGAPPWIKTNVHICAINLGKTKLYFLPDRMLVWDSRKYRAVSYESLGVAFAPTRYIEDGKPPRDSEVVDRAWRYMNDKGEPDPRYTSNIQLPVVVYGSILFGAQNQLIAHLHVSNMRSASEFAEIFRSSAQRGSAGGDAAAASSAPRDSRTHRPEAEKRRQPESRRARIQGRVKWFSRERGYGIIGAQYGEELQVHSSQVLHDDLEFLQAGSPVEFEVGQGPHGPIAAKVTIVRRNPAASTGHGTAATRSNESSNSATPWDVLGVSIGASEEEITAAYRRMAQMYHPDKVATLGPELKELADRRMKEINAAYDALKNR